MAKNLKKSSPEPMIKLVLNGGETELNSATFPVEWFFSPELIEKNPQFLVLCDHEGSLEEFKDKASWNQGYRYLVRAKKLVKFLQVFRPGRHHLVCIVFCGDEKNAAEMAADYYRGRANYYKHPIIFNDVEKESWWPNVLYSVAEFDVPEELFAVPPKKGLRKFIWDMTNKLFDDSPADQCRYRKRMLFLPLIMTAVLAVYLVSVLFIFLYTLVGSFILFLIGFRPRLDNINNIKYVVMNKWGKIKLDLFEFRPGEHPYYLSNIVWRLWKVKLDDDKRSFSRKKSIWIPVWAVPIFVPFELAVVSAAIYLIYLSFSAINVVGIIAVITAAFLLVLVLVISAHKKFGDWLEKKIDEKFKGAELAKAKRAKKREEEKKVKEKKYREFLLQTASISAGVPKEVDLEVVKKKVDSVTKFQIGFWALKAKVCKPYAK